MRNQFPFYGLTLGQITETSRQAWAGLAPPTQRELLDLALDWWLRPEREWQHAALRALRDHHALLGASALPALKTLITTKSWWDTVDDLATHVVSPLVLAHPELVATMDVWIESDNIWLARTAILHQERWKARTDPDRLFRYCALRAGDREFFIRKAIGWALRSYSAVDPEAVARFLDATPVSGLTRREAMKGVDRARARAATR